MAKIKLVQFRSLALLIFFSCPLSAADTVAVLPLYNHAQNPNVEWIGESAAETIRESLNSEGLLPLAREDRMEVYRRLSIRPGAIVTKATILKIGETLDAGQIVYGEFDVKDKDHPITLTAHILDLKKFHESPAFVQSGPLEDLSLLETKLAWDVVHALSSRSESQEAFLKLRPPVRIDAVELYTRGLLASAPDQKQKLFSQSANLDERYSQPAFQLGRIDFEKKNYKEAERWLARVNKADSHYYEALFLNGLAKFNQGEYAEAIQSFQAVAAELPLNEVFNDLGAAQSRKGSSEAEDNFKKALDGDQADPDYWFNLGYWQWKNGTFYAAADKFRAVLDRSPGDQEATSFLGRCLRKDGPHPGDPKTENRERLKYDFAETVFRQLQAEMHKKK